MPDQLEISQALSLTAPRMNDTAGEFPTALLPRLGLKPEANS
jgi:hypothetical protein